MKAAAGWPRYQPAFLPLGSLCAVLRPHASLAPVPLLLHL